MTRKIAQYEEILEQYQLHSGLRSFWRLVQFHL